MGIVRLVDVFTPENAEPAVVVANVLEVKVALTATITERDIALRAGHVVTARDTLNEHL